MLVYDITSAQSFKDIEKWMHEVEKLAPKNVAKLLVGNKKDLEDERMVEYEEGVEAAKRWDMKYIETSAKSGLNIRESFRVICEDMRLQCETLSQDTPKGIEKKISIGAPLTNKRGCCCVRVQF
eukprot:TRINITY_DN12950_c0_g1_i10.p1 TRINITY_DN12950_c0_g1~~TRINITY_DN12950_c0_g1_i10.p1  ORF type:complete len:124 (+),score=32.88 TRINITY_DN12950_c0_g1_i10:303-674(+)